MKATGIVRKVDDLGRIVIAKEIRKVLGIREGDPMEIQASEGTIILKKYIPQGSCIFCGDTEDVKNFKGKIVCKKCMSELKQ